MVDLSLALPTVMLTGTVVAFVTGQATLTKDTAERQSPYMPSSLPSAKGLLSNVTPAGKAHKAC